MPCPAALPAFKVLRVPASYSDGKKSRRHDVFLPGQAYSLGNNTDNESVRQNEPWICTQNDRECTLDRRGHRCGYLLQQPAKPHPTLFTFSHIQVLWAR